MSARCASCGQHNSATSRFCSFCGRLLQGQADASAATCPLCGAVFADAVACRTHQAGEHGLAAVRAAEMATGSSAAAPVDPTVLVPFEPKEPWYRRPMLVGPVAVLLLMAVVTTVLTLGGSRSPTVRVAQTSATTRPTVTVAAKPVETPAPAASDPGSPAETPAPAPPVTAPGQTPPVAGPALAPPPPTTATSAPAADKPIEIKESAFSLTSGCSSASACAVNWVAVLTNPNTSVYVKTLSLSATARNASGISLGTTTVQVRQIPPGVTFAVTGKVQASAVPRSVEIDVGAADWAAAPAGPDHYPPFTTADVTMSPSGLGSYQVQGHITNPYKTAFQLMNVTVLLRDANGKLLAGATTWLNRMASRETRPFTVTINDQLGTIPTQAEVIGYPWGAQNWLTADH